MRTGRSLHSLLVLLGALVLVAGCKSSDTPPEPAQVADAAPKAEPMPPAEPADKSDEPTPMEPTTTITRLCVGPLTPADTSERTLAGETWVSEGYLLRPLAADDSSSITIGTISDTKEASKENLENLQKVIAWFEEQKVDAIVFAGDVAETQQATEAILAPLAAIGVPVLITMGNRDGMRNFNSAIEKLNKQHPNLVNMNIRRVVELGPVSVVSLPGYYDSSYIHHADGCRYDSRDVKALRPVLDKIERPVLLLSHGSPRGSGGKAIDRAFAEANVGDPEMAKLIKEANVAFGVFGNVHEAGGQANKADIASYVAPETWSDRLFLNPGPVDSLPWQMNDGSESVGMAGVVEIKDGKGRYRVFRISHDKQK